MHRKWIDRIGRLPKTDTTWEIAAIALDLALEDGSRLERMLIVVEGTRIRLARPIPRGADPLEGLEKAFLDPTQGQRGRPKLIVCADAALGDALSRALGRVVRVTAGETPAAESAARRLMSALEPPPVPGITVSLALWKLVLEQLVALEPWSGAAGDTPFRYVGAELDGSVGVFMGSGGSAYGFVWFPTEKDRDEFLFASMISPERALNAHAVSVNLEALGEVDEAARARCEGLGLVLAGDRVPWVFAIGEGRSTPATPVQQQLVLRALSAALVACAGHLRDVTEGRTVAVDVRAADGQQVRVEVEARPPEDFWAGDWAASLEARADPDTGELRPTVVVSGDAPEENARLVGEVDRVRLHDHEPGVTELLAIQDDRVAGFLYLVEDREHDDEIGRQQRALVEQARVERSIVLAVAAEDDDRIVYRRVLPVEVV